MRSKIKDIDSAKVLFTKSYDGMNVPSDEEDWFISDLSKAFHSNNKEFTFFKIEKDSELISFAAIEKLTFTKDVWSLRWGTTDPEYRRQGLMSNLVDYRLRYAEKNSQQIGSVHIMARNPGIYLKRGFQVLYERGPENKASYMFKILE